MSVIPDLAKFLVNQVLSDLSFYRDMFAAVGLFYMGKAVVNLTWSVYMGLRIHFFSRFLRLNMREKYGCWAIVTGSTDGIGRAFCIELAKQGFNIAMISRDGKKLEQLANYIGSRYNVEVLYHSVDFTANGEMYRHIATFVDSVDAGILVNNVGIISSHPIFVAEMSVKEITDHIKVNVLTATVMTNLVLPQMLRKRKGAIINVSSIAALSPAPLLAVYAATKSYVMSFSEALREEVKRKGITVQTLLPSYVNTRMVSYSDQLASSFMTPSPETYVRSAVRSLGRSNFTTGYWLHGLQVWMFSCIPMFLRVRAGYHLNSYFRRCYFQAKKQ